MFPPDHYDLGLPAIIGLQDAAGNSDTVRTGTRTLKMSRSQRSLL